MWQRLKDTGVEEHADSIPEGHCDRLHCQYHVQSMMSGVKQAEDRKSCQLILELPLL